MLGESENRTYLNIAFGKLQMRSSEGDPKAKKRETKIGKIIWERAYNYVEGQLEKIFMREHEEYGVSWILHIKDGDDRYSVQVQEASRFGDQLLQKIPNLQYGEVYKFTPYDFEQDGVRKCGLSIKKGEDRVESYYHKFTPVEGGKTRVELLHGYPEYKGDWGDGDEVEYHFKKVRKFMRKHALEALEGKSWDTPQQQEEGPPQQDVPPIETYDDLPFN